MRSLGPSAIAVVTDMGSSSRNLLVAAAVLALVLVAALVAMWGGRAERAPGSSGATAEVTRKDSSAPQLDSAVSDSVRATAPGQTSAQTSPPVAHKRLLVTGTILDAKTRAP